MLRTVLRAKLHRARVTEARIHYEGSLTVDRDLLDAVGLAPFEKVLVANVSNGRRFSTYLIEGGRGTGVVCVNGAAAHLAKEGDVIIVMAFALLSEAELEAHRPRVAVLGEGNRVLERKGPP